MRVRHLCAYAASAPAPACLSCHDACTLADFAILEAARGLQTGKRLTCPPSAGHALGLSSFECHTAGPDSYVLMPDMHVTAGSGAGGSEHAVKPCGSYSLHAAVARACRWSALKSPSRAQDAGSRAAPFHHW